MLTHTELPNSIPLQGAQKSIYYFEQLYPATITCHNTLACQISGKLNTTLFRQAIETLMQRHEILRAKLTESAGDVYFEPVSNLSTSTTWPLQVLAINLSTPPTVQMLTDTLTKAGKQEIINTPFSLLTEPLWRAALLCFANNQYQFIIVAHQIIVDDYSKSILFRDLSEIYNALCEKRDSKLPNLDLAPLINVTPITKNDNRLSYWKRTLSDMTPLLLKTDSMTQKDLQFRGNRVYFNLDEILASRLNTLATQKKSTLQQILLTSLYTLLYRYTGQADICIGMGDTNRQDTSDIIFSLTNSIPLRLNVDGKYSLLELLDIVTISTHAAQFNQLPFDTIAHEAIEKKDKLRTTTASPFDIFLNVNQKKTSLNLNDTICTYPSELNLLHTKFTYFGLNLDELANNSYQGYFEYNINLYTEQSIGRIKDHLLNILSSLANNPNEKIANLTILTPEEHSTINQTNNTRKEPIFDIFVHDIFAKNATEAPSQNAVVYHKSTTEHEAITYHALNQNADILAAVLCYMTVEENNVIAISVKRSINLLTAIWATLKANSTMLLLETKATEMLYFKITETQTNFIIIDDSTKHLYTSLNHNITVINIDQWDNILTTYKKLPATPKNINTPLSPNHLAYISYTSGSTGKPKGVMISHGSFTNAAHAISDRKYKNGSNVLGTAQATFDAAIFEILVAVMTKGTLHLIYEEGRLAPSIVQNIIVEHQINIGTFLPQISNYLDFDKLKSLNVILIMGDIAKKDNIQHLHALVAKRQQTNNPLRLCIEYGVQEATIFSTEHIVQPDEPHTAIGKPIRNTQLFILDKHNNICPIGVAGELVIGGASLARGYINNIPLSNEKFVTLIYNPEKGTFLSTENKSEIPRQGTPDKKRKNTTQQPQADLSKKPRTDAENATSTPPLSPSSSSSGSISPLTLSRATTAVFMPLYKTGDCAKYLPDGSIDFIGRIGGDRQVKIHGVRIELDSLEATLQNHPNVNESIILFNSTTETLTAIITVKDPSLVLNKNTINQFLHNSPLPPVARFNKVVTLEKLPINSHGKIDRKALDLAASTYVDLKNAAINTDSTNQPQLTPLQAQLKQLWATTLNTDISSIDESFESLGGDSLERAILEAQINYKITFTSKIKCIDHLKSNSTIRTLANALQPLYANNLSSLSNPFSVFSRSSAPRSPTPNLRPTSVEHKCCNP